MTRYAQPTREQLEDRLKHLKQELIEAEDALNKVIEDDSLQAYKQAHLVMECATQDIEATIAKLHPHVPRVWYDKYGDHIMPTIPKIKGSPNDGLIEE